MFKYQLCCYNIVILMVEKERPDIEGKLSIAVKAMSSAKRFEDLGEFWVAAENRRTATGILSGELLKNMEKERENALKLADKYGKEGKLDAQSEQGGIAEALEIRIAKFRELMDQRTKLEAAPTL